ncbi:6-phosphogluconolactonase [Alcaligenaceae bacterium]|nr:6-phosphogluconolactonase [Alcaligenaceae bacterium]
MWHEYPDAASCIRDLAGHIAAVLRRDIADNQQAGLAVSGGRSPIALFDALSQIQLDWELVTITLVDERYLPSTHADSNERLVRKHLLQNRAAAAGFLSLAYPPEGMQANLLRANRQKHHITLAVLGMGEDGHTASLFPGAPQLARALDPARDDRYVHVSPAKAPYERISLSLNALMHTGGLVLYISGQAKRSVYETAARKVTSALPISYLIAQKEVPFDVYWHP